MSRSASAFLFSTVKLFNSSDNVTFWTFTFRETPATDDEALACWREAMNKNKRSLLRMKPELYGLRVTELHRNHGIHFHALLSDRVPVDLVYRCFWPHGFGRIQAKVCDLEGARYLAKYLSKRFVGDDAMRGRRLWSAFGSWPDGGAVRCKDVEIDSPTTRNYRLLHGERKIHYTQMMFLAGLTKMFGELADWPEIVIRQYHGKHGETINQRSCDVTAIAGFEGIYRTGPF